MVDFLIDNPGYTEVVINNFVDSDKIKQQLIILGPSRIRGLQYNITKIKRAMGITIFDKSTFLKEVEDTFIVGEKYLKSDIKEKLGEIYKNVGYEGTPKATDLGEWFELGICKIIDTVTKKRVNGFEIVKKK